MGRLDIAANIAKAMTLQIRRMLVSDKANRPTINEHRLPSLRFVTYPDNDGWDSNRRAKRCSNEKTKIKQE
jgi:hypothetical protein